MNPLFILLQMTLILAAAFLLQISIDYYAQRFKPAFKKAIEAFKKEHKPHSTHVKSKKSTEYKVMQYPGYSNDSMLDETIDEILEKHGDYVGINKDLYSFSSFDKNMSSLIDIISEEFKSGKESFAIMFINKDIDEFYFEVFEGWVYGVNLKISEITGKEREKGFDNVMIFHNHPGDVKPSDNDILTTKKLVLYTTSIGISLDDHIIFNNDDYYSFKENGIIDVMKTDIKIFIKSFSMN